MSSTPYTIFGCANVGDQISRLDDVSRFLHTLKSSAIAEVDTAARYPPTAPGLSQRLLGAAKVAELGFKVDTKIQVVSADPNGSLSAAAIDASVAESLASLGVSKIHILYCHAPDHQTPLEEQAAALDKHYRQGHFEHLGVSNFEPDMIEHWMRICDVNGYVKPTYYQGQYNLYHRHIETTLFPVLRKYNMRFTAFSPLAGGFLTGKVTQDTSVEARKGTRFEEGTPGAKAFGLWYDKPGMYDGNRRLRALGERYGLEMAEMALRWVYFHSMLAEGDGVIVGASKVAQLEASVASVKRGPLPGSLPDELSDLWHVVEGEVQ